MMNVNELLLTFVAHSHGTLSYPNTSLHKNVLLAFFVVMTVSLNFTQALAIRIIV